MLRFFRQIRKTLMEQPSNGRSGNKTSTYLLYAIGEIVLVMVGILLALQVNNWNESRKQNLAEQEFIEGVHYDLSQDREYIQLILDSAEKKFSLLDRLELQIMNLYENDRPLLDSLLKAYFVPERTFYPISGSFESAVSGNEISKFKNETFTSAVTKLYNSGYARLKDNAKESDNRWYQNSRKYARLRRIGSLPDMSREQVNTLLDDLYHYDQMLEYYTNVLKDTIIMIDAILDQN